MPKRELASTGEMVDVEDPHAVPGGPLTSEDGKPLMRIKVYAPFQIYFEGEGYSITATNETGPFDILPRHRNFLCMLVPCVLTIKTTNETKTIKISRALMHVKTDQVTVFVDV